MGKDMQENNAEPEARWITDEAELISYIYSPEFDDSVCIPSPKFVPDESRQLSLDRLVSEIEKANTRCINCEVEGENCFYRESNIPWCSFWDLPLKIDWGEPVHSFMDFVVFQLDQSPVPEKRSEIKNLLEKVSILKNRLSKRAPDEFKALLGKVIEHIDYKCLSLSKSIDIFKIYPVKEKLGYERTPGPWLHRAVWKKYQGFLESDSRPMPPEVDHHTVIQAAKKTRPPLLIGNAWQGSIIMLATLVSFLFKKRDKINWHLVDRIFTKGGTTISAKLLKDSYHSNQATPCEDVLFAKLPELKDYARQNNMDV